MDGVRVTDMGTAVKGRAVGRLVVRAVEGVKKTLMIDRLEEVLGEGESNLAPD